MEIGVSTASLYLRTYNEETVSTLSALGVKVMEVFLSSYSEYNAAFGQKLKKLAGDAVFHSVHDVTTQFEPQIFSYSERQFEDSLTMTDGVFACAKALGAKYYTFHGRAYIKAVPKHEDIPFFIERLKKLCDFAEKRGVTVTLENVFWCMYNRVGFFSLIKDECPNLMTCLDIKQARLSGCKVEDYIAEMGDRLKTVHLSDYDERGKMCLPGKGVFDFEKLFKHLSEAGFDGNMFIEAYTDDYGKVEEIADSLDYLQKLKQKIF